MAIHPVYPSSWSHSSPVLNDFPHCKYHARFFPLAGVKLSVSGVGHNTKFKWWKKYEGSDLDSNPDPPESAIRFFTSELHVSGANNQTTLTITNDHTSRWTSIWFDITFVSSYHGLQLVIFDILAFLPNSSFSQMMRPRSLMTFPTSVSSSTIRRVLSSGSPETINGRYYCESLTMWMHIDI